VPTNAAYLKFERERGGEYEKRTLVASKTMASSTCLHAQPKSFSASFNGLTRTETDIFSSLVLVVPIVAFILCRVILNI
jgi:hypothetical protein